MFTQQEIDDGDVSYVENGSVVTSDEFGLYVVDPSSPSNSPATIRVSVSTTGTAGGQVLTGSSGAETLSPGAGNNFLIGDGNSTASYADSPNGVTVNLANATVANGYGGTDTLTDIHSFVGASTGTNTVSYDGNRADYNIRQLGDGTLQVTDIRPGSPDGVDQYQSFQLFDFSNGTYNAVQLSSTTDDVKDAGISDILFRSDASGDTGFYAISNGVNVGWSDVGGSSTAYNIVGTGDFYSTGTTDILYRSNASGDTGFYQISNGANIGWHDIGTSSTAYSVVATGNYLGSGTSDILFRDNTTGDTGFYAISNGVVTGWHDVGLSSTAYNVVT